MKTHTHINTHTHTPKLLTLLYVNFRSMANVEVNDVIEWRRNAHANVEGLPRGGPHWLSLYWVLAPYDIKDRLLDVYDHRRFRHPDWLTTCGNCQAIGYHAAQQCKLCETIAYCSTKCKRANIAKHGPHCKRVNYLQTCLAFR